MAISTHEQICSIEQQLKKLTNQYSQNHKSVEATNVSIRRSGGTQKLANRNERRNEIWLHNKSDVKLHIGIDSDISKTRYSLTINPYDTLILSANNYPSAYKKALYGFWADNPEGGTRCMITEFIKGI